MIDIENLQLMIGERQGCLVYCSRPPAGRQIFLINQGDIDEINLCGAYCSCRFNGKKQQPFHITGRS